MPPLLLVWSALVLLIEIAGSIALWILSVSRTVGYAEGALLGLFAVAGALGGSLRSFGYLLAYASLSRRQQRQWGIEAVISPLLGAVAGLGTYLLVRASLVQGAMGVNRAGQYVFSALVGAVALGQVGRVIERSLVRGTLNRSGILGGEVSTTVPLLERIERTIEQRTAEYTLYNYDGRLIITVQQLDPIRWMLNIIFEGGDIESSRGDIPNVFYGRVKVIGGINQDTVPFTLAVVSDTYQSIPLSLSAIVPRSGRSEQSNIMIQAPEQNRPSGPSLTPGRSLSVESHIAVEVGQGSQILQVVPVNIAR